jgi:hypothetical protein
MRRVPWTIIDAALLADCWPPVKVKVRAASSR